MIEYGVDSGCKGSAMSCRIATRALIAIGMLFAAPSILASEHVDGTVLEELRQGGLVIFLRNGQAALGGRADVLAQLPAELRECEDPHNVLTDEARVTMREIGRDISRQGIPVGEVLSSPACRVVQSAWYAFGMATMKPQLVDLWSIALEGNREASEIMLRRQLSTSPEDDTNRVIASHVSNLRTVTNIELTHGEAAIFVPQDDESFSLLRRVTPDQWESLDEVAAE